MDVMYTSAKHTHHEREVSFMERTRGHLQIQSHERQLGCTVMPLRLQEQTGKQAAQRTLHPEDYVSKRVRIMSTCLCIVFWVGVCQCKYKDASAHTHVHVYANANAIACGRA